MRVVSSSSWLRLEAASRTWDGTSSVMRAVRSAWSSNTSGCFSWCRDRAFAIRCRSSWLAVGASPACVDTATSKSARTTGSSRRAQRSILGGALAGVPSLHLSLHASRAWSWREAPCRSWHTSHLTRHSASDDFHRFEMHT